MGEGHVQVLLNMKHQGTAAGDTYSKKITFPFKQDALLSVVSKPPAIMVINSLSFHCVSVPAPGKSDVAAAAEQWKEEYEDLEENEMPMNAFTTTRLNCRKSARRLWPSCNEQSRRDYV